MKYLIVITVAFILMASCAPANMGDNQTLYPKDSSPSDSSPNSNLADPSSVDVGQITPAANTGGENVVIHPPVARQSKAKLIHDISTDVGKRFGVDISDVSLVKAEEVIWKDESIGCPMPEVNYEKNQVSGLKIVVKLHDKEYVYHTKGLESFIWCDNGTPISPVD